MMTRLAKKFFAASLSRGEQQVSRRAKKYQTEAGDARKNG